MARTGALPVFCTTEIWEWGQARSVLTFHDPFGFSKTVDRFMSLENSEEVRRQRRKFLLIDYQDVPIHAVPDPGLIPDRANSIGRSRKRYQVLILRDPFNCMASRLVRYRKVTRNPPPGVRPHEMIPDAAVVNQWGSYAREFLGTTNHLSNKVTINFDHWHASSEYRSSRSPGRSSASCPGHSSCSNSHKRTSV